MIEAVNYGFYKVDFDYLKYLRGIDSEVYYSESYKNSIKPFVGVIVGIKNFNYFIPLSSVKMKHKNWKNKSDEHFLIYEVVDKNINIPGEIYKPYNQTKKFHILSILDIKK
ncbi:type III toxin-antitoxin system ToxN/AbiQ family toxin [Peptoniphilaceae bacterium SGI.131]